MRKTTRLSRRVSQKQVLSKNSLPMPKASSHPDEPDEGNHSAEKAHRSAC